MTDSYKVLGRGVIGTPGFNLLFSATNQAVVKNMRVVNTGAVDITFQLGRNGVTAAHAYGGLISVPAFGSAEWDGTDAFAAGDTLWASAGGSTLTFAITGDDIT